MAFQRRRAVAGLESRKLALITGFWANEGLNDDKGTRAEALEELDRQMDEAARLIYADPAQHQELIAQHKFTKDDEENPFLKPAIDATRSIDTPRNDEGSVKDALDSNSSIDQD